MAPSVEGSGTPKSIGPSTQLDLDLRIWGADFTSSCTACCTSRIAADIELSKCHVEESDGPRLKNEPDTNSAEKGTREYQLFRMAFRFTPLSTSPRHRPKSKCSRWDPVAPREGPRRFSAQHLRRHSHSSGGPFRFSLTIGSAASNVMEVQVATPCSTLLIGIMVASLASTVDLQTNMPTYAN